MADRTGTSQELRVMAGVTSWPWVLAAKDGVPQGQRIQLADLAWVLTGRRVTVVIGAAGASLWKRFLNELRAMFPARGSPLLEALPTPA